MLPSAEVVGVLCRAGLDFVLIDLEHSPIDFIVAQIMVTVANGEGKQSIIRVSKLDEVEILKALRYRSGWYNSSACSNSGRC
jgi:2-keto-3-deoxy-L-rhamnonate aldolase RhmA